MTDSSQQDLGTLVQLYGRGAVRYERVYAHAIERVWHALIEPASIRAWFPTSIVGLAQAVSSQQKGAKLRFLFEGNAGPEQRGELRACEPPRLLEYSWGEELLRFELCEVGPSDKHCKLVFTATFSERSQAPRDATGWHICLDNLSRDLDGEPKRAASDNFTTLTAQYVERIGSDFPDFLKGGDSSELSRELPAQGLEGQLFKSAQGVTAVLVRATHATAIEHRELPIGGYIAVIEGAIELHLGGHQIRFTQGMEFHIPAGVHVRGRMDEGSRLLFAAAMS